MRPADSLRRLRACLVGAPVAGIGGEGKGATLATTSAAAYIAPHNARPERLA